MSREGGRDGWMEGGGETFGSAFAPRFASLIRLRGSGREAFLESQVYLQR